MKYIKMVFIVAMLVSLSACGSSKEEEVSKTCKGINNGFDTTVEIVTAKKKVSKVTIIASQTYKDAGTTKEEQEKVFDVESYEKSFDAYKGMDIKVEFEDKALVMKYIINIKDVDEDTINMLWGFGLSNEVFEKGDEKAFVDAFEALAYTCK